MWSLGNELLWTPLLAKVLEVAKKDDPTRPFTFHDQAWGTYNNAGSTADIANYHYPGEHNTNEWSTLPRPCFGEYAHLQCYNRRELATDPAVREVLGTPARAHGGPISSGSSPAARDAKALARTTSARRKRVSARPACRRQTAARGSSCRRTRASQCGRGDGSRIRVLVAGFNTGGYDQFFATHYSAERRPLKKGGAITSSFRLVMRPGGR